MIPYRSLALSLGFASLQLTLDSSSHEVGSIFIRLEHASDAGESPLSEPRHHSLCPLLLPPHAVGANGYQL